MIQLHWGRHRLFKPSSSRCRQWLVAAATTTTLAASGFPSAVAVFHDLMPHPNEWKVPTENFGEKLLEMGISKIFFLRHGQTGKSDTGDFDRILTDAGREQARVAGLSFGKNVLLPIYPKVLVSPAPRTIETAKIFLESAIGETMAGEDQVDLVRVQDLYDNTMQPEGSKLFAKIGYAPLKNYLDAPNEYDRQVARELLARYASAAIDAIYNHLMIGSSMRDESSSSSSRSCTLLVVAHAIYLPAAALGVASTVGCDSSHYEIPLSVNTQEAEGYLVDLKKGCVTYLSR